MKRIWVTGHKGLVGSALCRQIKALGQYELVTVSRQELDLEDTKEVNYFIKDASLDCIIFASAKVGGIHANQTYPVEFMNGNMIQQNAVINGALNAKVPRLLFLGSTCIYPRDAAQPIQESALLTGPLEKTNEAYALAKIAGLKLCEYIRRTKGLLYHSAMPTNLFGRGDNYHPENSHVIPGMIRRFHEAKEEDKKEVIIWGSGAPRREFMYVDDLADALLHLISLPNPPDWVNVGTGEDISIKELAELISEIVGYNGRIVFDKTRPDGTMLKKTDISLLKSTGWRRNNDFYSDLISTYEWFLLEKQNGTLRE